MEESKLVYISLALSSFVDLEPNGDMLEWLLQDAIQPCAWQQGYQLGPAF